jgi:hypothetical protein
MYRKYKVVQRQSFYILVFLLIICPNVFSQSIDELFYPKADVHLGISLTKGSYIGTIFQISNEFSFEASYGGNIGLFVLHPSGTHQILSMGANYHFRYFILNLSYIHFEEVNKYFSHMASMNIALFSIDEPDFHLIGALGGFYEFSKHFSDKQKEAGVNFNFALGFTVL